MANCRFEECERVPVARDMCSMHYQRAKRNGDPTTAGKRRTTAGSKRQGKYGPSAYNPDKDGYIRVYLGHRQWTYVHRLVMELKIGRALLVGENVHHVNGIRDDNRPENLELWSISQPYGQRVEDKLRWAREIIALYGDDHG